MHIRAGRSGRGATDGAWSIPKGEISPGEDPLVGARREVAEELGWTPDGDTLPLTPIMQKAGKVVQAWAMRADWDPATLRSNTFELEWPRGSGRMQRFPEVDRAAWFPLAAGAEAKSFPPRCHCSTNWSDCGRRDRDHVRQ